MIIPIIKFLLESSVLLLIFYTAYYFLFRKLTFYVTNRFVLIAIAVLSFAIPAIDLDISREDKILVQYIPDDLPSILPANDSPTDLAEVVASANGESGLVNQSQNDVAANSYVFDWFQLILVLYIFGVLLMLYRLVRSIYKLLQLKKEGELARIDGYQVISSDSTHSFSFFNWIFLQRNHNELDEGAMIFKHELIHSRSLHSIDVLVFEILKAILWFNPAIYFLAKQSKLNNEFYTDQKVMKKEGLKTYSNALICQEQVGYMPNNSLLLVNSFALLSLKPRVMQLIKKPSALRLRFTYLSFLPIISLMLLTFSCNISEEVNKTGGIKSVKAYFTDEYGDQQSRNGKIIVDVKLDIDGRSTHGDGSKYRINLLKSLLSFVEWKKEVNVLQYKEQLLEERKARIAEDIARYTNMIEGKPLYFVSEKGSGELNRTARVERETNAEGFEIVRVYGEDPDKEYQSMFMVDWGELFDFNESGQINTMHINKIDQRKLIEITSTKIGFEQKEDFKKEFFSITRYDFTYDNASNLSMSSINGKLDKTFKYDENNRLVEINQLKNDRLSSSYTINYNGGNEIAEVQAFNGDGEIEYSVKYHYEFY